MTDAMTHRGPNDRGLHLSDGVALGVRRLSIVDVEGGHQPIANEDGSVWAIQNGELYNHVDIRSELARQGHAFHTSCDTEVLPHLYGRWGTSYPQQLRGMFGLAVWDERRRRAVISRDRLGIKPLYYVSVGDLLIFASELKALLASGLVDTELDLEAIDAYLNFGFFPAPRTPLQLVSKLLPGHSLVIADGRVAVERFWEYPLWSASQQVRSAAAYREELLQLLDESVRLRLMSDVPLGAMLSGGLDSSVIVALMARHMTEPVKTFSVAFREAPESNELADARLVSNALGTDHHELELSLEDDAADLEDLVWHLDEPLADLSAVGFLALSELAARHVTVALSGQGADELFAGYTKHRLASLAAGWERLPGAVRASGARLAAHAPGRVPRLVDALDAAGPTQRLLVSSGLIHPDVRREVFAGALAGYADAAAGVIDGRLDGALGAGPLEAALHLDAQLGLADDMLHYFDRASMARSLEVRVPFLDHPLVELCARIPAGAKVARMQGKHVLRQAARGLVPDFVLTRRKQG